MTYDGTTLKLYVNGKLDSSVALSGVITTSSNPLIIGAHATGPWGMLGRVDELSLYNRALTVGEITAIYEAGSMGKYIDEPPTITGQPVDQVVSIGGQAAFAVQATGTEPLSYQWRLNDTVLSGATDRELVLTNVQAGQAGNYSVMVTNVAGWVLSSNALLTVTSMPAPAGLVGWWAAESNALDSVGGNDGFPYGTVGYAEGKVGMAFALGGGTNHSVRIADAAALNPTNALTLETWVYVPEHSANDSVVVAGKDNPRGARQYMLGMGNENGKWLFRAHVGVVGGGYHYIGGTTEVLTNTWYHAAMTYDGTTLKLYVNGKLDSSVALSGVITTSSNPLIIGAHATGPWGMLGRVDELSLYNRALTVGEITAIYEAGSMGKYIDEPPTITGQPVDQVVSIGGQAAFAVQATGTEPLSYQWRLNDTVLSGATDRELVLTNVQAGQAGNYSVMVTNVAGWVLSTNATLNVIPQPCTSVPLGLVGWWKAEGNTFGALSNHAYAVGYPQYGPGKVGASFLFGGTNAYSVPASPSLARDQFHD